MEEDEESVSSSNSMSSNNGNNITREEDEQQEQSKMENLHHFHSYLEGAAHPLCPLSALLPELNKSKPSSKTTTLAILQVPEGICIFPGMTIPLRFMGRGSSSPWKQYLQSRINSSRQSLLQSTHDEKREKERGKPFDPIIRIGLLMPMPLNQQSKNHENDITSNDSGQNMEADSSVIDDDDWQDGLSVASSDDEDHSSQIHLLQQIQQEQQQQQLQHQRQNNQQRKTKEIDPWIGQIGTIAVITSTHGDSSLENGGNATQVWRQNSTNDNNSQQHERDAPLVVTALGTDRFRIVSSVPDDNHGRRAHHDRRSIFSVQHQPVRFYQVDELKSSDDTNRILPPTVGSPVWQTTTNGRGPSNTAFLAATTPMASFILERYWPWNIMSRICTLLDQPLESLFGEEEQRGEEQREEEQREEEQQEQENDNKRQKLDNHRHRGLEPTEFSFWMARNMPLQEQERIRLLQTECTVERLLSLEEKLRQFTKRQSYICCKVCRAKFSPASNLFTVPGAEGSAGAYVNSHGVIHQTWTLSHADHQRFFCVGPPETKDSWFPGYSWTITYCRRCQSHVGWLFRSCHQNDSQSHSTTSNDDVDMFWGLSGSSVTFYSDNTMNDISTQTTSDRVFDDTDNDIDIF